MNEVGIYRRQEKEVTGWQRAAREGQVWMVDSHPFGPVNDCVAAGVPAQS